MPAPATARKAAPIATPARAQTSARLPGRAPKAELPLEIRTIGRYGILELMRIGAGLSYREVGHRAGMPPIKAMRLIRGQIRNPRQSYLRRIFDVLWVALPAVAQEAPLRVIEEQEGAFARSLTEKPCYLTLEEAANLLKIDRPKMRRLCSDLPDLGAIKVGVEIRIPRQSLEEYLLAPRRPQVSGRFMSLPDVAALFRVSQEVIRYAIEIGRLRAKQHVARGKLLIPIVEVQRIARTGIIPLRRHKAWEPKHRNHARPIPR